ncbi:TPA: iron ABC transporter substrate-binding protein, partial [Escherichia coli]|nr:iron ABC transporter substrate-binding protein [Escherichia coli]
LMEYLISVPAQQQYAKANFEYPVLKGVDLDPVIRTTIGEIDVDKIPLTDIVKNRKQASLLVDKVGFDQ